MRSVLSLLRANPVTVASALVVLVSLGIFIYGWTLRSDLHSKLDERSRQLTDIDRYDGRSVDIPAEQPDQPPETLSNVTVTAQAVEQLQSLFEQMGQQYDLVEQAAVEFNQGEHEQLRPNFLPAASRRHDFRDAYARAFEPMLGQPNASGLRLNAGNPIDTDELLEYAQMVRREFESGLDTNDNGEPSYTDQELADRRANQAEALMAMLQDHAGQIHLYADIDADPRGSDFVFDVAGWAFESDPPSVAQAWEGQFELWIQQDIVRAIALANGVDQSGTSVLEAPVKRLLSIDVVPGYVGFHTRGGVPRAQSWSDARRSFGSGGSFEDRRNDDGSYPPPITGYVGSTSSMQPDNYFVGPSGRISNALYDVRHTRVRAIVDYQRLPVFFNALRQTNFISVLSWDMRDVNEYEHMREGYYYGGGDAVEIDVILESIWLRDWTRPLMPEVVQTYLGLDEDLDQSEIDDAWQGGGGGGGRGQPRGGGGFPGPGPGGPGGGQSLDEFAP